MSILLVSAMVTHSFFCLHIKYLKMKKLPALLALAALCLPLGALALDGSWRGELNLNVAKLPLVFNFSDGGACTLDSPAQGAKGIPAEVVFSSADSLAVDIPAIGATFRGRVAADEIRGVFLQGAGSFPLVLMPEAPIAERRPQTPKPPFPYQAVDTVFRSADGTKLAGTLVVPDGAAKGVPAVVMITGSGPQNRDEELFEHRPFAVIADALARRGIASFRYDDRGTAASEGNFMTADIDTLTADASAALRFLRTFGVVGKAGLLGHSEGGTIALRLAAAGEPDFVVSMAGMAVKGKDAILDQNRRSLEKSGITGVRQDDVMKLLDYIFDGIIAGRRPSASDCDAYVATHNLDVPPYLMQSLLGNLRSAPGEPFRKLLALDFSETLTRIKCPVLALNGTLDTQVAAAANLGVIKTAVASAKVREYPGLNHLFQHARTGDIAEYDEITETIAPEVLEEITAFIEQF